MRRLLTFAGIGCGGLLVLIIVIAVLAAAFGGGGQDTATQDKEEQKEEKSKEKEKSKEQEQASYGLNEPVEVGDASWVVTNAQKTNQLADPFGVRPPKEGTFVIVDFQFTNGGNEAKTLHQQALQLVDGSGRQSEPDTDSLMYIPQDRNIFLEQVNPGVTEAGQVIFTIAPDASDLKLVLQDTNLFRSGQNQAEVDLGF